MMTPENENENENELEQGTPAAADVDDDRGAMDERDLKILELEGQVASMRDEVLRERADLVNSRNRLAKDLELGRKFANEKLLADLLPVIDALEAGLAAAGGDGDSEALRSGMELTYRELVKVVDANGLKMVNPVGEAFNPEHHQAIQSLDAEDVPPGHVMNVFQKGWVLNGRLLRPALVVVRNH